MTTSAMFSTRERNLLSLRRSVCSARLRSVMSLNDQTRPVTAEPCIVAEEWRSKMRPSSKVTVPTSVASDPYNDCTLVRKACGSES